METSTHDFTCRIGVIGAAFRAASGVLLLTLLACGQDDVTDKGRRLDGPNPLATATPTAPPTATPTPPRHPNTIVVEITEGPENASFSNDPSPLFRFQSIVAHIFECRFSPKGEEDMAAWQACESPYEIEDLTCGEYSFSVRGVVDGTKGTAESRSWTVDLVDPEIENLVGEAAQEGIAFTWSCNEEACTYECQLEYDEDGSIVHEYRECDSPNDYSSGELRGPGDYLFTVVAKDLAGNESLLYLETVTWQPQ